MMRREKTNKYAQPSMQPHPYNQSASNPTHSLTLTHTTSQPQKQPTLHSKHTQPTAHTHSHSLKHYMLSTHSHTYHPQQHVTPPYPQFPVHTPGALPTPPPTHAPLHTPRLYIRMHTHSPYSTQGPALPLTTPTEGCQAPSVPRKSQHSSGQHPAPLPTEMGFVSAASPEKACFPQPTAVSGFGGSLGPCQHTYTVPASCALDSPRAGPLRVLQGQRQASL